MTQHLTRNHSDTLWWTPCEPHWRADLQAHSQNRVQKLWICFKNFTLVLLFKLHLKIFQLHKQMCSIRSLNQSHMYKGFRIPRCFGDSRGHSYTCFIPCRSTICPPVSFWPALTLLPMVTTLYIHHQVKGTCLKLYWFCGLFGVSFFFFFKIQHAHIRGLIMQWSDSYVRKQQETRETLIYIIMSMMRIRACTHYTEAHLLQPCCGQGSVPCQSTVRSAQINRTIRTLWVKVTWARYR